MLLRIRMPSALSALVSVLRFAAIYALTGAVIEE